MLGERVGEREGGETGDRRELGIHCGLGVLKYHASSFMRLLIFAVKFFQWLRELHIPRYLPFVATQVCMVWTFIDAYTKYHICVCLFL